MNTVGVILRSSALAGVLLLSACAGGSAQKKLIQDLRADIQNMRSIQAEQSSTIGALEKNLRILRGRLEELEFGQERKIGQDVAGLQSEISSIRRRLPPPAIVPTIELEADEVLASRIEGELGRFFSNALVKVRASDFQGALDLLSQALQLAEFDSSINVNLLFWRAVCHDGLSENKEALTGYHQLISRFPKHQRSALALLRQGSVFIRLGDKETAKLTFKKLLAEFPNTTEAARAKERLKDL